MKKRKKEGLDKEVSKNSSLNASYPNLELDKKKPKKEFKLFKVNVSYPKLKVKVRKRNLNLVDSSKFNKNRIFDRTKAKKEEIKHGFGYLKSKVRNIKLLGIRSAKDKVKKEKNKLNVSYPKLNLEKNEVKEKFSNLNSRKNNEEKKETKIEPFKKKGGVYRTDLDELYDLVEERGRVKLHEAAKDLEIDKDTIQKWGGILDEHELIHFHFPAFGEPEFLKRGLEIKEESTKRDVRKKRMMVSVSVASVILLLVAGGLIVMPLFQNQDSSELRLVPPKGEVVEKEKVDLVSKAFSGNGSYECAGSEIKYYIKNKLLRVESLRTNSVVVVKEGFIYTYNANDGIWTKSGVSEGMTLPGSGKVPGGDIDCKEEEVDNVLFVVKEGS